MIEACSGAEGRVGVMEWHNMGWSREKLRIWRRLSLDEGHCIQRKRSGNTLCRVGRCIYEAQACEPCFRGPIKCTTMSHNI